MNVLVPHISSTLHMSEYLMNANIQGDPPGKPPGTLPRKVIIPPGKLYFNAYSINLHSFQDIMSHQDYVHGGAGRDIVIKSDDATETNTAEDQLDCIKQCLENPPSKILYMIAKTITKCNHRTAP